MDMEILSDGVFFIPGRTNIGVVRCGLREVVLIDTGPDEAGVRRILKVLKRHGFTPIAVINTHFHSDHCGGNRFLKDNENITVYASGIAAAVIKYPFINSFSLFSGVAPICDLVNRFVVSEPSEVDVEVESGNLKIGDALFEIIPLPGHAPGQIGVAVNGVFFCADSLFAPEVIEKAGIPFNVDIKEEKETLAFLKNTDFSVYVPSHGKPTVDVQYYVSENLVWIEKIKSIVLDVLEEERSSEEVVAIVLKRMGLKVKAAHRYFLIQAAIFAYLSFLYNERLISLKIEGRPLWKRK
ncbi:MBL fold metallo-hydrolase [Desulfurobacterium sp.]